MRPRMPEVEAPRSQRRPSQLPPVAKPEPQGYDFGSAEANAAAKKLESMGAIVHPPGNTKVGWFWQEAGRCAEHLCQGYGCLVHRRGRQHANLRTRLQSVGVWIRKCSHVCIMVFATRQRTSLSAVCKYCRGRAFPQQASFCRGCSSPKHDVGHSLQVVDWGMLAGYEQQKAAIEDTLLLALQHPDVFDEVARGTRKHFASNRPRAVLFEGPPGCGKTTSARCAQTSDQLTTLHCIFRRCLGDLRACHACLSCAPGCYHLCSLYRSKPPGDSWSVQQRFMFLCNLSRSMRVLLCNAWSQRHGGHVLTVVTKLHSVIASQAAVPLVYVPIEAVASKWYGESERLLSDVFRQSDRLAGCIVFLDELDSLAASRCAPLSMLHSRQDWPWSLILKAVHDEVGLQTA